MRTSAVAYGTAVVVVLGVLALAADASGMHIFGPTGQRQNTTLSMPKAKHVAPNADGRTYAVIQICWRVAEEPGTVDYRIGAISKTEGPMESDCRLPFTRKGLVSPGDQVAVHWSFEPTNALRGVIARITVNNRVVKEPPSTTNRIGGVTYLVTGAE